LQPVKDLAGIAAWLDGGEQEKRFGLYTQGQCYRARVLPEALTAWLGHLDAPTALADLDVSVLHRLVLPTILPLPSSTNHVIQYTPDAAEATAMVDRQAGDCAWILRPIPLPQVFALGAQGVTLPQKSTYFYPKVLSGLVINPFDA